MLSQAIKSGAYLQSAGWTHKGLIDLATKYGMKGQAYDMTKSSQSTAFSAFTTQLKTGPVIASVHYKFEPTNPIPHLVVIVGMDKTHVYYNDPASAGAEKKLSIADFKKAWKQKFIVIRPVTPAAKVAETESFVVLARAEDTNYFASFFTRIVPNLVSRGTIG
jgi:ABC-type bacteriocin/lantibiotic exporter with double-glycine peptidase domain